MWFIIALPTFWISLVWRSAVSASWVNVGGFAENHGPLLIGHEFEVLVLVASLWHRNRQISQRKNSIHRKLYYSRIFLDDYSCFLKINISVNQYTILEAVSDAYRIIVPTWIHGWSVQTNHGWWKLVMMVEIHPKVWQNSAMGPWKQPSETINQTI